jgi:hypothetical protein
MRLEIIATLLVACHVAPGAGPIDASIGDAANAIDAPLDGAVTCAWQVETVGTSDDPSRPAIAATSEGIHILFHDPRECQSLQYAFEAAGATTWSVLPVDTHLGMSAQYFGLTSDDAGGLHASFYEDADINCQPETPRVMYGYKPAGQPWETFQVVTPINGLGGQDSAIAVDGAEVQIVYDGDPNNAPSLQFASGSLSNWTAMTVPDPDPIGAVPSLRTDPAHVVHVATMRTGAPVGLVYAERSAAGAWTTATIESGPGIGLTSSIEVDAAAGVHVAYTDAANHALRYAYRPAGGAWSTTPIDTSFAMVHETARIDAGGTLHVVYTGGSPFNGVPSTVRHAHAAIGGTWTIDAVGPDTGVFGAALALGPDDSLHVVYARSQASGGWDVRYARYVCN